MDDAFYADLMANLVLSAMMKDDTAGYVTAVIELLLKYGMPKVSVLPFMIELSDKLKENDETRWSEFPLGRNKGGKSG